MAKGSPTADENANFGVGAAPAKAAQPNIMPGASLTKAPKGLASGAGYWSPNDKLPAGVTAQWVPPAAAPTTVAPTPAVNRNLLAEAMGSSDTHRGVGSASHGDRQGATTSGSGWGGNSSANSGYGMGGRHW
jgi:hypothetical protein